MNVHILVKTGPILVPAKLWRAQCFWKASTSVAVQAARLFVSTNFRLHFKRVVTLYQFSTTALDLPNVSNAKITQRDQNDWSDDFNVIEIEPQTMQTFAMCQLQRVCFSNLVVHYFPYESKEIRFL